MTSRHPEYQYLELMAEILNDGEPRVDRTGVGTLAVFGRQLRFDLAQGFPLITTKKVHFRSVAVELFWMLGGNTNVKWLNDLGVTIWDEWADDKGELGPVYGKQWRAWTAPCDWANGGLTGIDQIKTLIGGLRAEPHSRRHILNAWNVADLPRMALAPCHVMAQFYSSRDRLSCLVTQRSADVFLGLPFNIASYALLTHMIAGVTGHTPGDLIFSLGDAHLYVNHIRQAQEQLERRPRPFPRLAFTFPAEDIDDYVLRHLDLQGYDPHPHIAAEVAK